MPFVLPARVSPAERQSIEALALTANDRYVLDLLERENLCPYAKAGRERGATARFVHFAETDDPDPIARIFEEAASSDLEVVQIIFPLVAIEAHVFARFVNDVTEALNRRRNRPVFASAALHPGLGYRRDTPAGLISLFRHAPDPTLQWVRLETLDNIYRGRKGGTSFVDLSNLSRVLEATPKRDLYEEIAHTNQATAERLGIDALAERLARLSEETQAGYQAVLQAAPPLKRSET
ncbi:MAG TPA: hypothetical protein VFU02_17100 [Polyangiaceae bacterium]|nr:hypothetical protein [Polyangiaceae bacterium]